MLEGGGKARQPFRAGEGVAAQRLDRALRLLQPIPRQAARAFDRDEGSRIAADDGDHPLWLLAAHTGMRRGELLGLCWADVDLDGGVLSVRRSLVESGGVRGIQEPKTASGRRTIALDAPSIAALRVHRARQIEQRLKTGPHWQDHDAVFTSAIGTPLQPSHTDRRFHALVARAGVPRIPFHGLRHTHATLLMKHGVNPKVVSERMGHAGIAITLQTYSHVLPQMQQEAAEIFAAAVSAAR